MDGEIRWFGARAGVRTAIWSLLPLASGCASDDPNADALVDGCWHRSFSEDYLHYDEPDWEPFTCSLPTICEPIDIHLDFGEELTPEEVAAVDASARCMLEAMRDGTPAVHTISSYPDGGVSFTFLTYYVLPEGVVGSADHWFDLGGGVRETYRRTRDDAFFDECLTQNEYPLGCLLGSAFPPLDPEACVDDVPTCPD